MPLKSDASALKAFEAKLRKLPEASKAIARAIAPTVQELANKTIADQAGPNGEDWPATKSGAAAFAGSSTAGRILARVVKDGRAVRVTVLYPLHFHQEGTHTIGRKRSSAIRRNVLNAYSGAVLKQMGLRAGAPRRRKDESDAAYQHRLERFEAAKQVRKDARSAAKKFATEAVDKAVAAGGIHDPKRPFIPEEDDALPVSWDKPIADKARVVMAWYGAEERC